jgi:hypothetical protein
MMMVELIEWQNWITQGSGSQPELHQNHLELFL